MLDQAKRKAVTPLLRGRTRYSTNCIQPRGCQSRAIIIKVSYRCIDGRRRKEGYGRLPGVRKFDHFRPVMHREVRLLSLAKSPMTMRRSLSRSNKFSLLSQGRW